MLPNSTPNSILISSIVEWYKHNAMTNRYSCTDLSRKWPSNPAFLDF